MPLDASILRIKPKFGDLVRSCILFEPLNVLCLALAEKTKLYLPIEWHDSADVIYVGIDHMINIIDTFEVISNCMHE